MEESQAVPLLVPEQPVGALRPPEDDNVLAPVVGPSYEDTDEGKEMVAARAARLQASAVTDPTPVADSLPSDTAENISSLQSVGNLMEAPGLTEDTTLSPPDVGPLAPTAKLADGPAPLPLDSALSLPASTLLVLPTGATGDQNAVAPLEDEGVSYELPVKEAENLPVSIAEPRTLNEGLPPNPQPTENPAVNEPLTKVAFSPSAPISESSCSSLTSPDEPTPSIASSLSQNIEHAEKTASDHLPLEEERPPAESIQVQSKLQSVAANVPSERIAEPLEVVKGKEQRAVTPIQNSEPEANAREGPKRQQEGSEMPLKGPPAAPRTAVQVQEHPLVQKVSLKGPPAVSREMDDLIEQQATERVSSTPQTYSNPQELPQTAREITLIPSQAERSLPSKKEEHKGDQLVLPKEVPSLPTTGAEKASSVAESAQSLPRPFNEAQHDESLDARPLEPKAKPQRPPPFIEGDMEEGREEPEGSQPSAESIWRQKLKDQGITLPSNAVIIQSGCKSINESDIAIIRGERRGMHDWRFPVIVLLGTSSVNDGVQELDYLRLFLGAIARTAALADAMVLDVSVGQSLCRLHSSDQIPYQLLKAVDIAGIAPAPLPGSTMTFPATYASHVVLVGEQSPDAVGADVVDLARVIGGNGRVVAVLTGGGERDASIAQSLAKEGWPLIVISGTGGLADAISSRLMISKGSPAKSPTKRRQASPPDIHLLTTAENAPLDLIAAEIVANDQVRRFPITANPFDISSLIKIDKL